MIQLPRVRGLIRRRLLVNYRVDPEVVQRELPDRLRPKLQGDHAIAGVCLIRLEQVRPHGLPGLIGLSSENAAHRVAVVWEEDGLPKEGVYIPRRDTSSRAATLVGGRIFPGEHHHASFRVRDDAEGVALHMLSDDGETAVRVVGRASERLPASSIFRELSDASRFFEAGSLGYSATQNKDRLDGLTLRTERWEVEPLEVAEVSSTYFENEGKFPSGTATFDHALVMRDIEHDWLRESVLYT